MLIVKRIGRKYLNKVSIILSRGANVNFKLSPLIEIKDEPGRSVFKTPAIIKNERNQINVERKFLLKIIKLLMNMLFMLPPSTNFTP